jgi:hypothetical protein
MLIPLTIDFSSLKIGYKIYNVFKVDKLFNGPANKRQELGLVTKIKRKSAKLAMTTFTYRSPYYLFYAPVESSPSPRISGLLILTSFPVS